MKFGCIWNSQWPAIVNVLDGIWFELEWFCFLSSSCFWNFEYGVRKNMWLGLCDGFWWVGVIISAFSFGEFILIGSDLGLIYNLFLKFRIWTQEKHVARVLWWILISNCVITNVKSRRCDGEGGSGFPLNLGFQGWLVFICTDYGWVY